MKSHKKHWDDLETGHLNTIVDLYEQSTKMTQRQAAKMLSDRLSGTRSVGGCFDKIGMTVRARKKIR